MRASSLMLGTLPDTHLSRWREGWARQMECIIGAHQDPLWAEATLRAAKGVVERWLRWVWGTGAQEEDKRETIEGYLKWLAINASGDNVERTAQRLLWIYKEEFTNKKIEELKTLGKRLVRDANKRNPVELRAADALPLKGLLEMIEGARRLEMMPIERIALDAFIISFATLSRMGEVLALRAEDVAEDGTRIRIRARQMPRHGRHMSRQCQMGKECLL